MESPIELTTAALSIVKDVSGQEYINLASAGVLGYQIHEEVIQSAIACTDEYGVGSCGPRGFYGSVQPHLDLEKHFAKFMGIPDSVLFSSDFQTPASIIPAFLKPGDYIVVDDAVSFAIQTGIALSRCHVRKFRHKDMGDLLEKLKALESVFKAMKLRVFVVVEGIFANDGSLVDLPTIMEYKKQYPFRLFLDESHSIGVLGKTGRGTTEHYGIDPNEVEIISTSIGNAVGSMGGIGGGSEIICNHMRLNCTGYVFSCSSPPYTAQAAITCFDLLAKGEELARLRVNVAHVAKLRKTLAPYWVTDSFKDSPYLVLRLSDAYRSKDRLAEQRTVELIVQAAKKPSSRSIAVGDAEESVDSVSVSASVSGYDTPTRRSMRLAKKTPAKKAKSKKLTVAGAGSNAGESRSENLPVLLSMPRFCDQELTENPPVVKICVSALLTQTQLTRTNLFDIVSRLMLDAFAKLMEATSQVLG